MSRPNSIPGWMKWGALSFFLICWLVEAVFVSLQLPSSPFALWIIILMSAVFVLGLFQFRRAITSLDSLLYFSMASGFGLTALFSWLPLRSEMLHPISVVAVLYTLAVPFMMQTNRGLGAVAALGHALPQSFISFLVLIGSS